MSKPSFQGPACYSDVRRKAGNLLSLFQADSPSSQSVGKRKRPRLSLDDKPSGARKQGRVASGAKREGRDNHEATTDGGKGASKDGQKSITTFFAASSS